MLDESELLVCALCRPEALDDVCLTFGNRIKTPQVLGLLNVAKKYKKVTGGEILTREGLKRSLTAVSSQSREALLALYDDVMCRRCVGGVCLESPAWKVDNYKKVYREEEIGEALTVGMDTLKSRGPEEAIRAFTELAARHKFSDTPVVDIRSGTFLDAFKREYAGLKTNNRPVFTGFDFLDQHTYGVMKSNLVLVAGYAGEGKSMALLNMAHHAQTQQHLNVAIATGEMSESEYQSRYLSRHSLFLDKDRAVTTKSIDRGIMTPDEERHLFRTVIPDLTQNENYGQLYMWQFSQGETVASLMNRCVSLPEKIDVLVVDYLSLLAAKGRRAQRWEELNDIIRDAKAAAVAAYNGEGLVLFTGFQTKRSAWETAQTLGRYTKTAFAESAEAERSADLAFWLLERPDDKLIGGIVKYRHGATSSCEFYLNKNLDYACLTSGEIVQRDVR